MTVEAFDLEEDDGDIDESVPEEGNTTYDAKKKYSKSQLEELADALLREDSNRELCRQCKTGTDGKLGSAKANVSDPDSLPYGKETGEVEWKLRKDNKGNAVLDDEDNVQYIAYPELQCDQGHRWYKGEGTRRNINGKNPILFEQHIYNRKRREIHVKDGIPDPAFTTDRWGRPTTGIYHRTHPQGRKVNSIEQRRKNGASFYR